MANQPLGARPRHSRYDVVIVGGAAVGSAVAWFLSENPDFAGRVLVVERDPAYTYASTALSASCIRHQYSNAINVRMSHFGTEFVRRFREIVGGDAPEITLHEFGYLFLAPEDKAYILRDNHAVQRECGAATELLSRDEVQARFPFFQLEDISLASFNPVGEGWFDGYTMMQALRAKARENGVEYVTNEVVDIARDGNRVATVRLVTGETISCGATVNAAGPRAAEIARSAGLVIPVEARKRCLFVFDCQMPLGMTMPLTIDPSGIHCRSEGSYFLAGTVPKPDAAVAYDDFDVHYSEFEDEIWPTLAYRVPQFEAIKLVNAWAGHYAYNVLDQNAIIGPHHEVANFIFANGFSGHGLQQSPAVGRGVSELITYGEYRSLDLSELGYERVVSNTPFREQAII